MGALFWTLILIACIFASRFMFHRPYLSNKERKILEIDELLTQAEGRFLLGKFAESEQLFDQAYRKSQNVSAFFASEALYGKARISIVRSDYKTAALYLEESVASIANWTLERPQYANLIRSQLEQVRRKI